MAVGISDLMREAILPILENTADRLLAIRVTFGNRQDGQFKLVPKFDVVELSITQEFLINYGDLIELTLDLNPEEYMQLTEHATGLECEVELFRTNKTSVALGDPFKIIKTLAIFAEKQDLLKRYSYQDMVPESEERRYDYHNANTVRTTFQLIDPTLYDIRKRQLHFIARDVTVQDVLYLLADAYGLKNTYIVQPDNTTLFRNFIIPPMMKFEEIFNFIQNGGGKGVYSYGFSYYYTENTFYVYPPYSTSLSSPSSIHIFYIGHNRYEGADSYDMDIGPDKRIVCNKFIGAINMVDEGLETLGTASYVQHGERIFGNWWTQTEDNFVIPQSGIQLVKISTDAGIMKDSHNPNFRISCENPYIHLSELAYLNRMLVEVQWQHAIPYAIHPGQRIVYHYDGRQIFSQSTGQVERVYYSLAKAERGALQLYGCTAELRLSIAIKDY